LVFLVSMDDIQTLIYFGLIIIWFLSRVFSKKKQKKPPVPNQAPTRTRTSPPPKTQKAPEPAVTFEDILRELTGTPVSAPAEPSKRVPDFPEIPQLIPEEEPHYKEEEPAPVSSHPDIIMREGAFKEFVVKQKKGPKVAREVFKLLKQPQGLKQAIILKEILDRPYN